MSTAQGDGPRSGEESPQMELNIQGREITSSTFIQESGLLPRGRLIGPGPSRIRVENFMTRLPSKNKHYGPLLWANTSYNKILQNIEGLDGGVTRGETHNGHDGGRIF